jgi:hypothetical protein
MNGSSISHDWVKVKEKNQNNKKKKIELNNRTGIFFCAVHTASQWNFFFPLFRRRKKIESIRSRSLNDPFTTLPFVEVKKNTMMVLLLYIFILSRLYIYFISSVI